MENRFASLILAGVTRLAVGAFILLALISPSMATNRPLPKDRNTLKVEQWLPYVVSKIAPLEWWNFLTTTSDIHREDYGSDWSYQLEKQNTWEFPRFCFVMFRPDPKAYGALYDAVRHYKGGVLWLMHDNCIAAVPTNADYPDANSLFQMPRRLDNPPPPRPLADAAFVKHALADLPNLGAHLEATLGLKDKPPLEFDRRWLTREGLATFRGPYEEFSDPGSWSTVLTKNPARLSSGSFDHSTDRLLPMGLGMFEQDALFHELGADWTKHQSEGDSIPILPDYPLLSRLDDITADAVYEPNEIERFLVELTNAQNAVKDPRSIRGLDKLIRIAHIAQKEQLGIYFGGQ